MISIEPMNGRIVHDGDADGQSLQMKSLGYPFSRRFKSFALIGLLSFG
jgi:hypothetical protein